MLLAMLLICVVSVWFDRKFPGGSFDERQSQFRGKASEISLILGSAYYMYILICLDRDYPMPFGTGAMLFLGILGQALLFHIYCIINRAALPLGHNGWLTALGYGSMSLMQIWRYIMNCDFFDRYASKLTEQGNLIPENYMDSLWMTLFLAIGFGVLAVLHLISMLWKVREDHE